MSTQNKEGHWVPDNVDEKVSFGVMFKDLLKALEVCGDTSVLEVLYPWLKDTKEGKKLLKKKKAVLTKKPPKKRAEKETKPEEDEIILKMSRKTAEVLNTVVQHVGGPPTGPRGEIDKIYKNLGKQKVGYYTNCSIGTIAFKGDSPKSLGSLKHDPIAEKEE